MNIKIESFSRFHELFGNLDLYIEMLEKAFNVEITSKEEFIIVTGSPENEKQCKKAIDILLSSKSEIDIQSVSYVIEEIKHGSDEEIDSFGKNNAILLVTNSGKPIKAKTSMQTKYLSSLEKNDVTFGIGPAGTGKTFLSVATAIKYLKTGRVNRIIITRPAVEAGENLGFLPGDLQDKVDPYLRPIFDAMYDILGAETFQALREKGVIEIAPLAYMRGRTLDGAFVILDEAQNTTPEQMKMFLTRFGERSKVAVNGDITQIDLPKGKYSGLKHAIEVLAGIEEISFIYFTERDVVRHPLVRKIIKSYADFDKKKSEKS